MVSKFPRALRTIIFLFGVLVLGFVVVFCFSVTDTGNGKRYERTNVNAALMPPSWWVTSETQPELRGQKATEFSLFGTDQLGRDLFSRCIVGGAISIGIGLFAAFIAVLIGTLWGATAALKGGMVDSSMMRFVDILYGLPTIMLVVLITVAANGLTANAQSVTAGLQELVNVGALLVAIGAVSWLTVSRVIRGQVKSIASRPSIDACRTIGVSPVRTFTHHVLPALVGPMIVYATLTIPTAILAEAFLSFLGIGVREPLPSWGNLAADGLSQLNPVHSRWWLLFWPCFCIAITLISMNWLSQLIRRFADPTLRTT